MIKYKFEKDANYEDMESIFVDIDNDNDLDLYVVSGGNEFNNRANELTDRIYLKELERKQKLIVICLKP